MGIHTSTFSNQGVFGLNFVCIPEVQFPAASSVI